MELFIEKDNLMAALNKVVPVIEKRTTVPVLANLYFRAISGGGIDLAGYSMDTSVRLIASANVKEAGATTIDAFRFKEFVNTLKDTEPISLHTGNTENSKYNLYLKAGSVTGWFTGIDAEEFPIVPTNGGPDPVSVQTEKLIAALKLVEYATFKNQDEHPVLSGVHLICNEESETIRFESSDGIRLSQVDMETTQKGKKLTGIIPKKSIRTLISALGKNESITKISSVNDNNSIVFQCGTIVVNTQLIAGSFPDVNRIINGLEIPSATVKLSREHWLKAVRRARILGDILNIQSIKATNDLLLSVSNVEMGEISAKVPAEVKGQDFEVHLGADYMINVLVALESEDIELGVVSSTSPVLLKDPENDKFTHVLMPIHIGR